MAPFAALRVTLEALKPILLSATSSYGGVCAVTPITNRVGYRALGSSLKVWADGELLAKATH